jgi:2-oxoglutarate ferredoxin oxidoreductase subunit beta
VTEKDLYVHDEHGSDAAALLLARLPGPPETPIPMGIFREVSVPTFESNVRTQIQDAEKRFGPGDLEKLIRSGDTWVVKS